ncbi:hypothetical protein AB0K93_36555, partial [Streptomyces sp. NPDC052676]|uniref:hypothetical protein n=1 Tax=Streptomyces sp. NPDC052676 TaxID=3154953 RepID=UPI00341981A9
ARAVLVAELAAIGVSGIVIELGPRMSRVPDAEGTTTACGAGPPHPEATPAHRVSRDRRGPEGGRSETFTRLV